MKLLSGQLALTQQPKSRAWLCGVASGFIKSRFSLDGNDNRSVLCPLILFKPSEKVLSVLKPLAPNRPLTILAEAPNAFHMNSSLGFSASRSLEDILTGKWDFAAALRYG